MVVGTDESSMKGRLAMKVSRFLTILFVAAIMLVNSRPALGYTVTLHAEGVVTDVQTYDGLEFDGSVTVGSIMTGSCTYDTEAPDQYESEASGFYSLISIAMKTGNYSFSQNPAAAQEPWFHITAEPQWFNYHVCSPESIFYGPCYLNGQPTNLEDLNLLGGFTLMGLGGDNDGTVTDALPDVESFPDFSAFNGDKVFHLECVSTPAFHIHGAITSLTVVPEPASVLLFALGALAMLQKHKS